MIPGNLKFRAKRQKHIAGRINPPPLTVKNFFDCQKKLALTGFQAILAFYKYSPLVHNLSETMMSLPFERNDIGNLLQAAISLNNVSLALLNCHGYTKAAEALKKALELLKAGSLEQNDPGDLDKNGVAISMISRFNSGTINGVSLKLVSFVAHVFNTSRCPQETSKVGFFRFIRIESEIGPFLQQEAIIRMTCSTVLYNLALVLLLISSSVSGGLSKRSRDQIHLQAQRTFRLALASIQNPDGHSAHSIHLLRTLILEYTV